MFQRKTGIQPSVFTGSILSQKEFFGKLMIKVVVFGKSIANSNNNAMFRNITIIAGCKGKGYDGRVLVQVASFEQLVCSLTGVTEPQGSSSGKSRVLRGGSSIKDKNAKKGQRARTKRANLPFQLGSSSEKLRSEFSIQNKVRQVVEDSSKIKWQRIQHRKSVKNNGHDILFTLN